MSDRLIQILASLAQRRALRGLDVICETQHQISTRKLEQYLEQVGDELVGHAHYLRVEYDALTCKIAQLEAELAKLRVGQEPVAYKDDPRSPSELSLAGCNCVRYGENNPHWPCRIHTTPQPSAVPEEKA